MTSDAQTVLPPETFSPAPGAAIDPGRTGGSDPAIALVEKIERASVTAIEQHLSESKKGRGKRGPDKKPRKPRVVSLEKMGNGADPALLEEGPPSPLEPELPAEPTFDEETTRTLIEIGCGLLNDGAAAVVRAVAKKETCDEKLADEAAAAVRMSEKIESAVKTGAMLCAKKYAMRMDYAPEVILGGGLVIWAGQVSLSVKALRAKGAELRTKEEKKAA